MRDTLEFIFSSFWIWLGTVIMLGTIFGPLSSIGRIKVRIGGAKANKTEAKEMEGK